MRKWVKRFLIFLASIILLVLAFIVFLHTSWGKSIVRNKVQKYLRNKLETTVAIGKIDYRLPNWIKLENIIILDRRNDTLLHGGSLYVKINMLKLLSQKVEIDRIELENINLQIAREQDENSFNYQFIVDAFSSPSKEPDTSKQSKPMQLSVNYILLNDIGLRFDDKKEKKYLSVNLDHFFCSPHHLDPGKPSYEVKDLLVSGLNINLVDSSSTADNLSTENKSSKTISEVDDKPSPLLFSLDKLGLRNIAISFKKPLSKTDFSIELDSLQLDESLVNAKQNSISSKKFTLSNSVVKYYCWIKPTKAPATEKAAVEEVASDNNWKIAVDEFVLNNNSFIYHNQAAPVQKGFDYNHLDARQISLTCSQNKYSAAGFNTEITNFSTVVNDQINLKALNTTATYTDSVFSVKDLAFALNNSNLKTKGNLVWPLKPITAKDVNCSINSTIRYADILQIQPQLQNSLPISLSASETISIAGTLKGSLQNFKLNNCRLSSSSNTFRFVGNVALQNVSGNNLRYDASIDQLQVQRKLLSADLLSQLEKQNINLPANISVSGKINGTAKDVTADLKLTSDFGKLNVKGFAGNISQPKNLEYHVELEADNLETGKWIHQDSLLGKVSGNILVKGSGTDLNNISANTNLKLRSFVFNGYHYSNIDLAADLATTDFTVKGGINDPNIITTIDLQGNFNQPYPTVNGFINIDHADLRELQLVPDSIVLTGKVKINSNHPDSDTGKYLATIFIDGSTIVYNGKKILLDSLLVRGYSEKDSTKLTIEAPFVNAAVSSNCTLKQLPTAIDDLIQDLYAPKAGNQTTRRNEKFSLNGSIVPHPLLSTFVPDFEFTDPITFSSEYDAEREDSIFDFHLNAPSLSYSKIGVDGLSIDARKVDSVLDFALHTNNIQLGTDSIFQTSIKGQFVNKFLTTSLHAEDNKGRVRYAINSSTLFAKDSTVFKLVGDLIANRNQWEVANDNRVVVREDGFLVNNLSLSNQGQTVYIASKDPQLISPIDFRIDSFEIGNLLRTLSFGDTTVARGKLTADITVDQPINKFPLIAGTIEIKDASVQNIPVGDIQVFSETKDNSLHVSGNLSGITVAKFDGSINTLNDDLRLALHLQKLDVHLIQQFASEYISRTSGNCSAELNFSGTINDPRFSGKIDFDTTSFAINNLFALYKLHKQSIAIDYPDILFNQFTLYDSLNNKFVIDGKVKILPQGEYGLDLKVDTKNLIVMNAPRQRTSEFYGKAIISADLKIGGTSNEPSLEGSGKVENKTSIHYLLSQSNSYSNKEKGVVQFVDFDTLQSLETEHQQTLADSLSATKTFKGLNYNLNLEVDKEAEFSIIIDPTTNDELFVKGEGQVNVGIGEGGSMGITGLYELKSGYYKMNNQILKGKFVLIPGSTISFNGDPNNAQADVKTQYEVKTTATGLLSEDESSSSSSQRIPFLVILNIKGPLSKPIFSFDIKIDEKTASINSQLRIAIEDELDKLRSNTSEMNKQAFSLLVMNHFTVTEGGDLSSTSINPDVALRQGMSYFLSAAMNEAAGNLIKGVDIDVNLNNYKTDNSSSSNTDVEVTLSKKMFNDRMIVTVGENVLVGNGNASNAQQYIPDVTSTYKLSKDGRYQVKAYLKDEYDAVVEGYFSETGVSFVIEMDYNKFKEIFQRAKTIQNH